MKKMTLSEAVRIAVLLNSVHGSCPTLDGEGRTFFTVCRVANMAAALRKENRKWDNTYTGNGVFCVWA